MKNPPFSHLPLTILLYILFTLSKQPKFFHSLTNHDSQLSQNISTTHSLTFSPPSHFQLPTMGKKVKFNWSSFFIGATAATTTTFLFLAKPKVPKFKLVSLTSLQIKFNNKNNNSDQKDKVNFPRLDADLILTIHVTNPNILPVNYSATSLSIYYDGSLLGSAHVPAGFQPPNSCQLLRLQARLNGQELAQHVKRFIGDVSKREMVIGAEVDICGWAKTVLWGPRFKVHVDSRIVVDPLFLDIIDQDNESSLQLFVK